jgi:hypothetical protein
VSAAWSEHVSEHVCDPEHPRYADSKQLIDAPSTTARSSASVQVVAGRHLAYEWRILTGGGYTKYRISGSVMSS